MSSKRKTILITGGLGQIGYYLYEELKSHYNLCILDNKSTSKFEPPEDVIFIEGDIIDNEVFPKLPDLDYVIHLAAQISIEKSTQSPLFDAEINIMGTLNALEYALKQNIQKFVYISSAAIFGHPEFLPITEDHPRNPLSPYGLSKSVAEKYVKLFSELYNLNTAIVIPFNLYSPIIAEDDPYAGVIYKFIKQVKHGKPPVIQGKGDQSRDFVHVKDAAKAIKLVLEEVKGDVTVFNIGSGKSTTINDLAKLIIEISGKDLIPQYTEARLGDINHSYSSIDRAKRELNYNPVISLKEGLEELYLKLQ
ncbi:MAG: NAD-dependent epimerase/dehydratase family protein [Candidatus Heimdallarchaeota archaeon]|nr:NAD-dependent epimerase/dehydratase family protein [Candidatus Heimdallarchaeota archaeon]MCG3255913.1 NAD-dependent epimerase/dehydratase family protein [Candidatus Heimdallarchaeota archaeon]MCK4610984.1 NAD-dependent epimerase/dehydratase family protein [Candidatus Heimdallarchaeota archaeon]